MAVAGLVLGVLSVVSAIVGLIATEILCLLSFPIAVAGLILSVIAYKKEKSNIALAGLIIGIIATIFTAIVFSACGLCVLLKAKVNSVLR